MRKASDAKARHILARMATLNARIALLSLKYSPEQPRDEQGRWAPWDGRGEGDQSVLLAANDGTPRNNQAQNKQVDDVVRILGLNKDQRRILHLEISGQNLGFQEILRIGREIRGR